MASEQPSLTTKNAKFGMSSDCANLQAEFLEKTSHSSAEASNKASNADPNQKEESKELFPEKEEGQTDMGSQRTLMSKELLEAATNGDDNTLTQLLGLDEGESPDSARVTIEFSNIPLDQTENLQSATRIGNTFLHILASNGHTDLAVKTYMKDRSLLEVCNNTGETALHCAARYGHSDVISKILVKSHELEHDLKDKLRKKNMRGETALHEAARCGHVAVVEALITEDPELAGEVNKNDESPLYLATVEEHVAVVQLIVQHLCKREITFAYYSGPKRMTALHAAVLRKKGLPMVEELLKLEPATLAKRADIFGSTPLHYVASTEEIRMARRLLEHDASLAYCDDSFGLFPVHVAAYMGMDTVVILLENNLDSWELLDHRGRNFLHLAAESDRITIPDLIKTAGKARRSRPKLREVLCKASRARDNEGNTPLHIAARCGDRWAVKPLLGKEWVDFTLTSLDNLALSYGHSKPQVSKSTTDESYEKLYQHYKTLLSVVRATNYPRYWLLSYVDEQKPPESSGTLASKVQTIALGSVLIATVTFAAAFTLPGGYNSSDGTPVLGKKYAFRAFILADVAAFASSFICTYDLIFLGANMSGRYLQKKLYRTQYLFTMASISMGLAFALGLYVVLAPLSKGFSIFVLLTALLAALRPRRSSRYRRMQKWVLNNKN